MFWSLVIEPGKRYSSTVKESFHLSMATLDVKSCRSDTEVHPVLIEVDGQELLLCNLSKSGNPHAGLDLIFQKGTDITFSTSGKATIHLTGYCIQEDSDDYDDYSSIEEEEDESFSDLVNSKSNSKNTAKQNANKRKLEPVEAISKKKSKGGKAESSDDDEDEDDDNDSDSDSVDLDDSKLDQLMGSVNEGDSMEETDEDDSDLDDDEQGDNDSEGEDVNSELDTYYSDDGEDDEDSSEDEKPKPKQPIKQEVKMPVSNKQKTPVSNKKQEKQQNKNQLTNGTPQSNKKDKNKNQGNQQTPKQDNQKTPNKDAQKDKTPKKGESTPQSQKKQTLSGGVVVEDLKPGNGQPAKYGKMVQVYYTGRLKNNNRVFDKSTEGPGFKFRLGNGEVIKGWDVALNGMKVGGKRRITIPPGMGYGNKGSPPTIPPNSWLVFDVEMKSVN